MKVFVRHIDLMNEVTMIAVDEQNSGSSFLVIFLWCLLI